MTAFTPSPSEVARYYRAAIACLHFVEARRPTKRRFGPDADARWKAFKGHLSTSDRIDLLLRDANSEWPGAFGAREVFAVHNVAEDEAFGAHWQSLDPVQGDLLWRELAALPNLRSARDVLSAVARAWDLTLQPTPLDAVDPSDKLVAVGPSAVAALAEAFVGRPELDWAAQVTCVATSPAHRQIALAASAAVDTHRASRVLSPAAARHVAKGARVLLSDDAATADRAALPGGD